MKEAAALGAAQAQVAALAAEQQRLAALLEDAEAQAAAAAVPIAGELMCCMWLAAGGHA